MTENSCGLLGTLSAALGTNVPALKLLLTVFAGYPLALVYRKYVYAKPPTLQHLFFIVTAALLGYWNYGFDMFHTIFAISFTYCTLLILGGTEISLGIVFVYNMFYLLTGYYYVSTENYDINWTMPQCILTLRLIGTAFDLYDGQQDPETLSAENKKVALTEVPTVLEFFGHMMFPASFMVGPQFPMKRYQDFVAGKFSDEATPHLPPNSEKAAVTRLCYGLVYLAIFQVLGHIIWDDYLVTEDYANLGFFYKILLMGLWGRYTLYKYISCWLLTEGACILFGVSYNGVDEDGAKKWDGLENIKLSVFEHTTEFNHYIQSFNVNTNHWVAQYIYKRLKFLGNRHISQLAALVFLAVWHGFHTGYYVCFFFEFVVILVERDVKSIVTRNETLSNFFGNPAVKIAVHFLLRAYTFVFMGWCLFPFALLQFDRYWKAFGAVYHIGTLVFVAWPIIYSPIMKLIFKPTSKPKSQ